MKRRNFCRSEFDWPHEAIGFAVYPGMPAVRAPGWGGGMENDMVMWLSTTPFVSIMLTGDYELMSFVLGLVGEQQEQFVFDAAQNS